MGICALTRDRRMGIDCELHCTSDVPPSFSTLSGCSRGSIVDRDAPRRDCSLLFVPSCPADCDRIDQLFRDLCHLLHRSDSLHWCSDFTTSVCFSSGVFTLVPLPVRCGLRCVGGLYAAGVFADPVRRAACAARATVASSRINREIKSGDL